MKVLRLLAAATICGGASIGAGAPGEGGRWIGVEWGAMAVDLGGEFSANADTSTGPVDLPEARGEIGTARAVTLLHAAIAYRQGFDSAPWLQLGGDLGFAYFLAPSSIRFETGDQSDVIDGFVNEWGGSSEFDLARVSLRPKIYVSLRPLFGWPDDRVLVFAGAAFDFNQFYILVENHRKNPVQDYGQSSDTATAMVATLRPILGVEVPVAPRVSFCGEASYQTVRVYAGVQGIGVNDFTMAVNPAIQHGFAWGAGLRYYFSVWKESASGN